MAHTQPADKRPSPNPLSLLASHAPSPASASILLSTNDAYLDPSLSVSSTAPADPALHLIPPLLLAKLKNISSARCRDMRDANISTQILTHIPIDASLKKCQALNDRLHVAVEANPERFRAMAMLPLQGREAAEELERCVLRYGFVGGSIGFKRGFGVWCGRGGGSGRSPPQSPIQEEDEEKEREREQWLKEGGSFEELWKVAERLKVPIALEPLWPTNAELTDYDSTYPGFCHLHPDLTLPLITHFHPFHTVSPLLLLHIYLSGIFDRHPGLHLILSQTGHTIPSLLPRIKSALKTLHAHPSATPKPTRPFLDVWQHNIYLTTDDVLDVPTLRALVEQIPADRVLFSAKYPWGLESGGPGRKVLDDARESGVVGEEEWTKVGRRNAEGLFGISAREKEKGEKWRRVLGLEHGGSSGGGG